MHKMVQIQLLKLQLQDKQHSNIPGFITLIKRRHYFIMVWYLIAQYIHFKILNSGHIAVY